MTIQTTAMTAVQMFIARCINKTWWVGNQSETVRTEAVEAEGAVVEEEADVASPRRHAAEGVCTAGCQRINAAGGEEDQQGPGEGVLPCCLHQHHSHQLPQEVPGRGRTTLNSTQGVREIWKLSNSYATKVAHPRAEQRNKNNWAPSWGWLLSTKSFLKPIFKWPGL